MMAAEFPLREDFELGGWTVRPGRLMLERGGEVVHVKPKTMEVLVALAERAGEVVTREQLLENVWQHTYVTDDVITQAIGELRRALHDDFPAARVRRDASATRVSVAPAGSCAAQQPFT